jgi:hypothetical protein
MASRAAPSFETPEERDARLQAEWDALPPEVQEARRLGWKLEYLESLEAHIDARLTSLSGRDVPLVDGSPGRERGVVCDSSIEFFRGLKERCVEEAANLRGLNSLF